MFGIEYLPEIDIALKEAARKVNKLLSQHERVILSDSASFNLLAPYDCEPKDLWLVNGKEINRSLAVTCAWQPIKEEDFKDMGDLYHLYEFSPYFLLLEWQSPYLEGVLRLHKEAGMSLDDVVTALLRR